MRSPALTAVVAALSLLVLAGCEKPTYIELDPKEHTFKRVGEDVWWHAKARTRQGKFIHTKTVSWSSSDPKVIAVDAKGRVKAVGPGRAMVRAQAHGLVSEAPVEVQGVGKVTLEPTAGLTLDARGEGKPITIKVFDLNDREVSDRQPVARCQDENVCRVFPDGVHGVDSGETTLVVTCEGARAEIPVKVLPTDEERIAKGLDVEKPRKSGRRK